jgi:hypothetical protein
MQKVHAPHIQPIKTEKFGPKLDAMNMQNNPFRAAYHTGHDLNESYKLPSPNASGKNPSYARPHDGPGQTKGNKMPAGPVQLGKNSF